MTCSPSEAEYGMNLRQNWCHDNFALSLPFILCSREMDECLEGLPPFYPFSTIVFLLHY